MIIIIIIIIYLFIYFILFYFFAKGTALQENTRHREPVELYSSKCTGSVSPTFHGDMGGISNISYLFIKICCFETVYH